MGCGPDGSPAPRDATILNAARSAAAVRPGSLRPTGGIPKNLQVLVSGALSGFRGLMQPVSKSKTPFRAGDAISRHSDGYRNPAKF